MSIFRVIQFKFTRICLKTASMLRRLLFISEIPWGPYCYTKVGKSAKIRDSYKVTVKMCPFYQIIKADGDNVHEDFAYCTLVKDYDKSLLDQQIKICGKKEKFKNET